MRNGLEAGLVQRVIEFVKPTDLDKKEQTSFQACKSFFRYETAGNTMKLFRYWIPPTDDVRTLTGRGGID